MNIRKAYRISKPDMLRNGIRQDSAVGRWLVSYEVIGRNDLYEMNINDSHIMLESLRSMIRSAPVPEWEHEQPRGEAVCLYDFFPPTEHCDGGWNEIDDAGVPIGYDHNGQA